MRTCLQRTRMHAHHEVRAIGTGACNMQLSAHAQHSPQGHNFVHLWSVSGLDPARKDRSACLLCSRRWYAFVAEHSRDSLSGLRSQTELLPLTSVDELALVPLLFPVRFSGIGEVRS